MNLNQVTVPAQDVAATVAFYQLLGLRLIVDSIPRYARLECLDGDTTFSVHHVDGPPAQHGTIVYFECEDLDDQVARLQAAGIVFRTLPQDQTWLWREASLRDPSGNAIILYWGGKNRKFPDWRLPDSMRID